MFINDIFKKKQLDEGGPFSYGAKKPRKGSVADLAAQKRKEQEHGKQPAEPRDQRVGVARVVKDVAEGISVVDQDYDLDQMHLTLDIEGKKVYFTYWDYEEDFSNAERRDVFDQLQEQPWYKGLDHPTKMEILDAAYRAIRGLEPQEYRPTVRDEPLDEQGVAEGVTSPEIKQAYDAIMKTAPKSPERKRAIKHYQQLRADALDKKKEQGVAEGFDDLDRFMKDKYGPQPRGGSGIKTGTYGKPGRRRGRPAGPSGGEGSGIPQALDFDRPHSDRSAGRKLPRYSDDYDAVKRSEIDEDWKKVNRQDRTPGMSRKAVKAYRRENPGSKLQTAVTTKPSKLKKGSKSAKRRKSFCARMKGMKRAHAGAKTKRNPDSPINKALRRWNCESIEEMQNLVMIAEQKINAMRINESSYTSQFQTIDDAIIYAKEKIKSFRDSADGIEIYIMPDGGADLVHTMNSNGRRHTIQNGGKKLRTIYANDEQGVTEGSAQDRLHKRHQELRKKSGLPDPDYYKELKASYDLPDEERYAKQKEIKQKYKVTNEDREQYIEELGRAGYEIVTEKRMTCPECGGAAYSDQMLAEKQDACYHKVKSRYKVWPSAYASGALVRCRKKGAKNWGNKSK